MAPKVVFVHDVHGFPAVGWMDGFRLFGLAGTFFTCASGAFGLPLVQARRSPLWRLSKGWCPSSPWVPCSPPFDMTIMRDDESCASWEYGTSLKYQ